MTIQHYRMTLDEAIEQYNKGLITSTGIVYYYLKIKIAPVWTQVINQKQVSKILGISRSSFYRAIEKLGRSGAIEWEATNGLRISWPGNKQPDCDEVESFYSDYPTPLNSVPSFTVPTYQEENHHSPSDHIYDGGVKPNNSNNWDCGGTRSLSNETEAKKDLPSPKDEQTDLDRTPPSQTESLDPPRTDLDPTTSLDPPQEKNKTVPQTENNSDRWQLLDRLKRNPDRLKSFLEKAAESHLLESSLRCETDSLKDETDSLKDETQSLTSETTTAEKPNKNAASGNPSNSYQKFIKSLSNDEREKFFNFFNKKQRDYLKNNWERFIKQAKADCDRLPKPPTLPESLIRAHFVEFCQKFIGGASPDVVYDATGKRRRHPAIERIHRLAEESIRE